MRSTLLGAALTVIVTGVWLRAGQDAAFRAPITTAPVSASQGVAEGSRLPATSDAKTESGPAPAILDSVAVKSEARIGSMGDSFKGTEASFKNSLSAKLTHDLALIHAQQQRVDEILVRREEDIQACHEAMRVCSIMSVGDYEWKVAQMKDRWFRQIDGVLNPDQHARFVILAREGFFNEGLAFTIEPGMTILD